jgi:predicted DNA-binding transcriptional regulator YafY
MNRTDRLYAMVEELRAIAPRPRSARWLARRFEVCTRTVERDIGALQESGVPIYAEPGRTGGYTLDKAHTLPPVNVSPAEAVAIAVALRHLAGTPFADAAGSALRKLVAVMPPAEVTRAEEFGRRVHLVTPPDAPKPAQVPPVILDALAQRRVLRMRYADRRDQESIRLVEPLGYVGGREHWYLLGWCRLRDSVRVFRLDRVRAVRMTDEVAPQRAFDPSWVDIPRHLVSHVSVAHVGAQSG